MLCGSHLRLRHLGKGLLGGYLDFVVKNDVSSDTLEKEVFELEVVKVKIAESNVHICVETIR